MMIINPYVYAGLPANEVLHLDFDGPDGSTTFTDATGRHVPTAAGSAAISTDTSYDGTSSLKLQPGKNFVRCNGATGSSDFIFLGDFSINCYAKINSFAALYAIYFVESGIGGGFDLTARTFMLAVTTTGVVQVRSGLAAGGVIITGPTITSGAWHNFVLKRVGSTVTLEVDGATAGTYSNSAQWGNGQIYIGGNNSTANMNGYVDKFIVTKN